MAQVLGQISLVVKDYDEALDFYIKKLSWVLVEDTQLNEVKRWVVIAPPGGKSSCNLLLAKAKNEQEANSIGNQTGGRVFLFLYTDNIEADLVQLQKENITIIRPLEEHAYGKVLVFADLYGNLWDLIQRKP